MDNKSYLDCIETLLLPNSLAELVNDNKLECVYRGVKVEIQHIVDSIDTQDVYAAKIINQLSDEVNSQFIFRMGDDEHFRDFIIDMFTKIKNTCDLMTTED